MTEAGTPPIVKRYAVQRLHDPAAGVYLTPGDLAQRVEDDEHFVTETATGEDTTQSVLKQIIVERRRHG